MTTRRSQQSQSPDSDIASVRSLPWLSLGIALSAVSMCGAVSAFVSAQPGQGFADSGWLAGAKGAPLSAAFGAPSAEIMRQPAKWVSGIGGETFSPGARQNVLAEAELQHIVPNIAPVAWDRLSAGDCITVTAKSGQTFSFRILGARPAGKTEEPGNLAKIELAVGGCADMGEPVAKAVIQPTVPVAPKTENAARTL